MLSTGAHIKIGTQEARVAFDIDGAYSYALDTTGEEVLFWLWEDWGGGEGNDAFDTTDEIVYHQGLVNPRRPGRLTCPPTRANNDTAALSPVPNAAFSAVTGGTLTLIGEGVSATATSYWYTTAPAIDWTEQADSTWNTAIDRITAVCVDGSHIFVAGMDDTTGGFEIKRIKAASGARASVGIRDYSATDDVGRILGMYVLGNYLYYWNGVTLFSRKIDTAATGVTKALGEIPIKTTSFLTADLTYGTSYWGGMTGGDGNAYFFNATDGRTTVYEVSTTGAANEIWNMPSGFTAKGIAYQSGAILLVGEYLTNAALFGMSVVSRQPIFLGFIRYGTAVSPEIIGAGFGSEVLMSEKSLATNNGEIYIYDIAQDAFSQLDVVTHTSGECWSVGTWQDKRYMAYEDGSEMGLYYWSDDDTPSTTVDGRMETGAWTFDLPEDEKQLDGIHVLSDAGGGKSVEVFYQDNEDGTWTSAGTATSGFHNFLTVSTAGSTVKFRSLRLRVDPKGGATVYSVSARCRVNTYEERWEVLLDLSDETIDGTPQNRRRGSQDKGYQLRDYIRDIADNKSVVTFLDGARYPALDGDDPDKYSTHTVIVDIPVDRIEKPGEGTMLVRLRSVAVN